MSKKKANKESFLLPFILNEGAQDNLDLDEKERKWIAEKKGEILAKIR